ncbi:hypothetical protein HAX54_003813, partial [Datura stramonium]|nr:hypothetical protein [Datura stramonium]
MEDSFGSADMKSALESEEIGNEQNEYSDLELSVVIMGRYPISFMDNGEDDNQLSDDADNLDEDETTIPV